MPSIRSEAGFSGMTTKRRGSGKKKSGKPRHDRSYKRLFSHPELVRDLLTGFVHEEWV